MVVVRTRRRVRVQHAARSVRSTVRGSSRPPPFAAPPADDADRGHAICSKRCPVGASIAYVVIDAAGPEGCHGRMGTRRKLALPLARHA